MRIFLIAALILPLLLAGCGNSNFDDLRAWMASTGNGASTRLPPLPQVKPFDIFVYKQANLQDPFMPRSLLPKGKGGPRPDFNRPKQPLEEFPLDSLRMVGTLTRPNSPLEAIIKDPKGTLHTVQVGDRIGQNYGTITKISGDGLEIKELIQGGSGEWVKSKANMTLTGEGSQ